MAIECIFYILLFAVSVCSSQHDKNIVYPYCEFDKYNKDVLCTGTNLTYIPHLPRGIQSLRMVRTNLTQILKESFCDLALNNLHKLVLTDNRLFHVEPKAFLNFSELKALEISKEPHISFGLWKNALSYFPKLEHVSFTKNEWRILPPDMFNSFNDYKLHKISLDGNHLKFVNFSTFKHLRRLTVLILSNNEIEHISVSYLSGLRRLSLRSNRLPKVPDTCELKKSNFPNLRELDLSNNSIRDIEESSFKCLPSLEVLRLSSNNIGRIRNNIFSPMLRLASLSLDRVGNPLKVIEHYAFNSSSLRYLRMRYARFHFCENRFNPKTVFAYCPNLEILDLSHNVLPKNFTVLRKMFHPLSNLSVLRLVKTDLILLPKRFFMNFRSLHTLMLGNNGIFLLNSEIFENVSTLQVLDLRSNSISVIKETTFPKSVLNSLNVLNLNYNPFTCSCDQLWFLNWKERTNVTLVNYFNYICTYPIDMNGFPLNKYHPSTKQCTQLDTLITIAMTVAPTGIFILLMVFLLFKCQTNIRNYVYLLRVSHKQRRGFLSSDGKTSFEYHAFVVYCEADCEWVHTKFLRKVEHEGMKLCVHHRDFHVGQPITGNIDKFLQQSWKVVLIMSNDFARSEWCQWEVDVVQERRRRQGKDVLLPIMLKNIDSKHMTSQLRTLLASTSHLEYSSGIGEDLFWKAVIEILRKPIGHPPVAVL